jgi:hypothetical protein
VQYDSSTTAVDAVTREGGGALVRKKKEEQSCSTEKCIKRVWVARATRAASTHAPPRSSRSC